MEALQRMKDKIQHESPMIVWSEKIVNHPFFSRFIITLILINSVIIGLETYSSIYETYRQSFIFIDRIILWLFTIEIVLKLMAARFSISFFKDKWNVFDFIIVASGHLFVGSQFVTVLRILRVLRVFRTISVIPSLRRLVNALLLTIPSLGTILLLMGIVFYIFAVIGTVLFKEASAEYFGTLHHSLLTLFQMVTLESWASGVMRPVMENSPWAWPYFVAFILIGTFIILNLFVGVIVNNFEKVEAEENGMEEDNSFEELKREMNSLRGEIRDLKKVMSKASSE
jgi:voltage-gated sodium channel